MEIPILELQIDKDGQLVQSSQEQDIVAFLNSEEGRGTTDIVLFSHGWNNNLTEARQLCRTFVNCLSQDPLLQSGRKLLTIALLWPSKRFEDAALIPGGAAATDSNPAADAVLLQRLEDLKTLFGDKPPLELINQLKAKVPSLTHNAQSQADFVQLLGTAIGPLVDRSQISDDEGRAQLINHPNGPKLLLALSAPIAPRVKADAGGAAGSLGGPGGNPALRQAGGATGITDFFSGVKAGALRLLNYTTYSVMKDRAGRIGRDTVNPFLNRLQQNLLAGNKTIAFHLAGHSFGGRLVTAAVDGPNRLQVQTLLLLQGAYSHNGLSSDFDGHGAKGFFFAVVNERKVSGPILITHSIHDSAVGLAYPIVSRLNGVNAARVGDANDLFGGMGANGAQHVPATMELPLLNQSASYNFAAPGIQVYNLNGDSIITSHGDVARAETAHALAVAITTVSAGVAAPGAAVLGTGGR